MLSIIICSLSAERLSRTKENIQKTIDSEYEIIAINNKERCLPIAKAYNEGASKATYPYLLFVHEDVEFLTTGWGKMIETKLAEPDCGVIGFAGSKIKMKCYSGWDSGPKYSYGLLYQGFPNGEITLNNSNISLLKPFQEVVTIDGLAMFARKDVWEQYPFDEKVLTGFHGYDIDFSLSIAASGKYKNYICGTYKLMVVHYSQGNFDTKWCEEIIRLHKQKWNNMLPLKATDFPENRRYEAKRTEKQLYNFVKMLLKTKSKERRMVLLEFIAYPHLSWKHAGHIASGIYTFFRYL